MTPAEQISQMIEHLPPDEKELVVEYIHLLHNNDKKYREYILEGIRKGEETIEQGHYYESKEARKRLLELLKK
jgi:hypothetical protein